MALALDSKLADAYVHKAFATVFLGDGPKSIDICHNALIRNPDDWALCEELVWCLHDLALEFRKPYKVTKSLSHLKEAIAALELAIKYPGKDVFLRASNVKILATCLDDLYSDHTNSMNDLNRAIGLSDQALKLIPESNERFPDWCDALSIVLLKRHDREGDMADLDRYIELTTATLSSGRKPEATINYLHNIGHAYEKKYDQTKFLHALNLSIQFREILVSIAVGHPKRPINLNALGKTLTTRFERANKMTDLDRAISVLSEAIQLTTINIPLRCQYLHDLSAALEVKYEQTGSICDLNKWVTTREEAAGLDSGPEKSTHQLNLAAALSARYEKTESVNDLNRAIAINSDLIKLMPIENPNRVGCLNNLATSLLCRSILTHSQEDAKKAESLARQGLQTMLANDPNRSILLTSLGNALETSFDLTGSVELLNQSIANYTEAIAIASCGDHQRYLMLLTLSKALRSRFDKLDDFADLNRSIAALEQARDCVPVGSPKFGVCLTKLGVGLHTRFIRLGPIIDLDCAIAVFENALKVTSMNDPDRLARLDNLGQALLTHFHASHSVVDLDKGIALYDDALKTANDDRSIAVYQSGLSTHLTLRADWTASEEDLERAVNAATKATELMDCPTNFITGDTKAAYKSKPREPRILAQALNSLARALIRRFEHKGSVQDLNRSIDLQTRALPWCKDTPSESSTHHSLGYALSKRFERLRATVDLDRSIEAHNDAVKSAPKSGYDRELALQGLSQVLLLRFKATGSVEDLDRSVSVGEEAVNSALKEHSNRRMTLFCLGNCLLERFHHRLSIADLNRAIEAYEEARKMKMMGPFRSASLQNLGSALLDRSSWTGSSDDLNRGVLVLEEAATLSPADPECLANLSMSLSLRYQRYRSEADLMRGWEKCEEAILSVPQHHPARPQLLSSMGLILIRTSDLLNSRSHQGQELRKTVLDKAVVIIAESAQGTKKEDPELPRRLNHLALALLERGSDDDLEYAIAMIEDAINLTPESNKSLQSNHLITHGNALLQRFEQNESIDDLNDAITAYENALISGLESHFGQIRQTNLAHALLRRHEITGSKTDYERSLHLREEIIRLPEANPNARIRAAIQLAELIYSEDIAKAGQLLNMALDCLRATSPRALPRKDQQNTLAKYAGMPSFAAAICLETGGGAYEALQLLEVGRGIIISFYIETRSGLGALEEQHPEIAMQFKLLQDELDSPDQSIGSADGYRHALQRLGKHNASERFDATIKEIRQLKGFERFLLAPLEEELMSYASLGPIVVFNVNKVRSDALIVTTEGLISLNLPDLREEIVNSRARLLKDGLVKLSPTNHRKVKRDLIETQEWLWKVAVGPVLEKLGYTGPIKAGNIWPHVWWIACGSLGMLPIHTAGRHGKESTDNALDRVISSYAASIKSLVYVRERASKFDYQKPQEAVLVSMSQTPKLSPLRYVEKEITVVDDILRKSMSTKVLRKPTKVEVIPQLRKSQIIHFACHGQSADQDPSRSSLLLDDWETNPLTVADINGLKIESAELAYLSACHAANNQVNERLTDEAIHLAGACQLAGFPHVVGTLWQIDDEHSAKFAADVYMAMLNDSGRVDARKAAEAVHRAVRLLREETGDRGVTDDPLVWAPYIYIGA